MNKAALKLWIEALESGKYTQTTNVMHNEAGCFCATGVLCDVAVKQGIISQPELESGSFAEPSVYRYDGCAYAPPTAVAGWLSNGDWSLLNYVMKMNDYRGKTFTEIAAYLRTYL